MPDQTTVDKARNIMAHPNIYSSFLRDAASRVIANQPKPTDLDGMRRAADDGGATETYLHDAVDEIERLRAERDKFEKAWQDALDRYESLLNQLGARPTQNHR